MSADDAIAVPGWCEQVVASRKPDGSWWVYVMGDAHGTGQPSCAAASAPTVRAAADQAIDIAEGWQTFSLTPDDTEVGR